jgi:hypothetical protein
MSGSVQEGPDTAPYQTHAMPSSESPDLEAPCPAAAILPMRACKSLLPSSTSGSRQTAGLGDTFARFEEKRQSALNQAIQQRSVRIGQCMMYPAVALVQAVANAPRARACGRS